ncbi:hypothetical protein, partial [Escherichia coli]|uniref:hypothetical protein n=1 Tax=Escherichia coli TaxID=562 RepID=UPI0021CEA239
RQKQKKLIMLPSETMIWQPEFTDKTLSRKPGAVQDTIEGQNAFITRITSIKEVQHVSFHKSSGCNYGCISLCHRPFPLHFEPDSFLPDRLASIFLIPALSKLHCQNADNRLTFKS